MGHSDSPICSMQTSSTLINGGKVYQELYYWHVVIEGCMLSQHHDGTGRNLKIDTFPRVLVSIFFIETVFSLLNNILIHMWDITFCSISF